MTTDTHRCLIVEDDQAMAEELALLLGALGFAHETVDNRCDALLALQSGNFCVILLDLQIKPERDSIKGDIIAGHSLLREIRRQHPERTGRCYQLPILVVSGYAREADEAVEVMQDGADDVLQKPLDRKRASERIRQCLEKSDRVNHDACLRYQARKPAAAETVDRGLVLAISGERIKQRTRIIVGGRVATLPDDALRILLHLVVGKLKGERVHKVTLGASADQGFQGVSRLRRELERALPEGIDIIDNDYHGNYWLTEVVQIGSIRFEKLAASEHHEIRECADELKRLAPAQPSKV